MWVLFYLPVILVLGTALVFGVSTVLFSVYGGGRGKQAEAAHPHFLRCPECDHPAQDTDEYCPNCKLRLPSPE